MELWRIMLGIEMPEANATAHEERRYDAHCGPVGAEGESGGASIEDRVPRIRTTEALLAEPLARKRHVGGGMRRLHRGE